MTIYQFVGVDVAKDKFDIAYFKNNKYQHKCFDNNKKGRLDFSKWLQKYVKSPWVCMEATGHYSEVIADFLYSQDIRVSIVNPLQIKNFSRMKLSRNKNDMIDAKIIAEYGEKMLPRTFSPRTVSQKELKDLTKLLDMLKAQLVQLKNQLHSMQGNLAKKAIQKIIKELEKKIETIEQQLAELVGSDNNLKEKMMLVTSIKGIGETTAYKVLAQYRHSCFSNAKQFAAFMGVSPKQNQLVNIKGERLFLVWAIVVLVKPFIWQP